MLICKSGIIIIIIIIYSAMIPSLLDAQKGKEKKRKFQN